MMLVDVPPPPPAAAQSRDWQANRQQRRGARGRGNRQSDSGPAVAAVVPCDASPSSAARAQHQEATWKGVSKRSHGEPVPQALLEVMIHEFKTMPCNVSNVQGSSHDHRCCPYYHSERDRRRIVVPQGVDQPTYRAEFCNEQFDSQRLCSRGDQCDSCHNTAELLYHPDVFRKRLCYQANRCPRGSFCAFAHSRCELLVPHFGEAEEAAPTEDFIAYKFKTQWCPIGGPHDWENCVYAHTYRDWRRTPLIGYSSRPCSQWARSTTSGSAELAYEDRCGRGFACHLAHGSKEQLYHPQFYKTSLCSESFCKRGPLCAFFHGPHDTRSPNPNETLGSEVAQGAGRTGRCVEDLLERHQPRYWNPPKYHTLEDPPYGAGGAGASKGGKGRAKNRQAAKMANARQQQVHDMGRSGYAKPQLQVPLPMADMGEQWGHRDQVASEYPMFPVIVTDGNEFQPGMYAHGFGGDLYQWVPCVESPTHQHSPLVGYGELDPWGVQMGYAPVPWNPSSAMRLEDGSGMYSEVIVPQEHSRAPKPRSQKYALQDGMRTPSSFNGTPPMSATPTEVPSPRPAEAAASSLDGSGDVSSDEMPGMAVMSKIAAD